MRKNPEDGHISQPPEPPEPIVDGRLPVKAEESYVYSIVLPYTDDSTWTADAVQEEWASIVTANPSGSTEEHLRLLAQRFNTSVVRVPRTNEQETTPPKEKPDTT
jgi:hypothetical protein